MLIACLCRAFMKASSGRVAISGLVAISLCVQAGCADPKPVSESTGESGLAAAQPAPAGESAASDSAASDSAAQDAAAAQPLRLDF